MIGHEIIQKCSLVLGQEIYFTSLLTLCLYTIRRCLPIFSSILAQQAARMGSFWILTDQGDRHWRHQLKATKTNT